MAEAITIAGRDGVPVGDALTTAARTAGRHIGENAEADAAAPAGDAVSDVLARYGYEPRLIDGEVVLANCPFHRLAADYTRLMCGMNLDLIGGLLQAVRPGALSASLNPGPDRCCVTIAPA
jgi:predicted ArsR family transcriptional regulator